MPKVSIEAPAITYGRASRPARVFYVHIFIGGFVVLIGWALLGVSLTPSNKSSEPTWQIVARIFCGALGAVVMLHGLFFACWGMWTPYARIVVGDDPSAFRGRLIGNQPVVAEISYLHEGVADGCVGLDEGRILQKDDLNAMVFNMSLLTSKAVIVGHTAKDENSAFVLPHFDGIGDWDRYDSTFHSGLGSKTGFTSFLSTADIKDSADIADGEPCGWRSYNDDGGILCNIERWTKSKIFPVLHDLIFVNAYRIVRMHYSSLPTFNIQMGALSPEQYICVYFGSIGGIPRDSNLLFTGFRQFNRSLPKPAGCAPQSSGKNCYRDRSEGYDKIPIGINGLNDAAAPSDRFDEERLYRQGLFFWRLVLAAVIWVGGYAYLVCRRDKNRAERKKQNRRDKSGNRPT